MSTPNNVQSGLQNATDTTLTSDFSDSDYFNKRKPRGLADDFQRRLSMNDSSKRLPMDRDSAHEYSKKSNQDKKNDSDKKLPGNDLSDSDLFSKRKLKGLDDSGKRLPSDNESFKKLPTDNVRDSSANDSARKSIQDKKFDIERKTSEIKRQNSISGAGSGIGKKGQSSIDPSNNSGSTIDSNSNYEGKKANFSIDLLRRATTKDLSNLSGHELPLRSNSISRRISVSNASDEDVKKQLPVLTRINSKLTGLLKNMRWVEENDGSRARKLVKTMADFNLRYTVFFIFKF